MEVKRIEKTINSKETIHNITFENNLKRRIPPARRQGSPKFKWAEKGIKAYWETIQKAFKYFPLRDCDQNNEEQTDFLKQYASAAIKNAKEEWSKFNNTEPIWNKDKTRAEPPEPQKEEVELRLYTDGTCPENTKANAMNCPAGWGIAIRKHWKDETTEKKT